MIFIYLFKELFFYFFVDTRCYIIQECEFCPAECYCVSHTELFRYRIRQVKYGWEKSKLLYTIREHIY